MNCGTKRGGNVIVSAHIGSYYELLFVFAAVGSFGFVLAVAVIVSLFLVAFVKVDYFYVRFLVGFALRFSRRVFGVLYRISVSVGLCGLLVITAVVSLVLAFLLFLPSKAFLTITATSAIIITAAIMIDTICNHA